MIVFLRSKRSTVRVGPGAPPLPTASPQVIDFCSGTISRRPRRAFTQTQNLDVSDHQLTCEQVVSL